MTINRTTLLDLPLPVTGTEPNTWGDVVNYGLTEYLDIAIAGSLALSTDADVLLASTEGTASADNIGGTTAQYAVLRCTGARTVTRNITAPAWAISSGTLTDYSKTYIVVNETTGGQNIVLRATNSATPTYTTGVTIVPGERAVCVWNGSDFVKAGGVIGGSNTQVQYNNGGVLGGIANATSDGTTLSLTSPKVITGINDTNGNELLKVTATASAVNELTLANAATGNAPTLSATGDDTNIGINITPKGSGAVTISNLAVTTIDATNIEVTNIKAKDGTASITLADSTGVASFTANPVLSGGTANGVLYLNGSKVATSGSALTFDGTNFSTTGTATATKLVPTGNVTAGNGMYLPATNTLAWSNNGAETMRLDSSGNLGVGVTPSTGSTGRAIELLAPGMGLFNSASNIIFLTSNAYNNSGFKYGATGEASYYAQWLGAHIWSTAPFGVAGNAITFSQVMTLDASGNLGIGTSSIPTVGSTTVLAVGNANGGTQAIVQSGSIVYRTSASTSGVDCFNPNSSPISWYTSGTERMRLDASGNLGIGVTPSAWNTFKTMQIGAGASVFGHQTTVDEAYLSANLYFSSGNKYIGSGAATLYSQSAGSHSWSTATSGTAGNAITFTQAMTLDASGRLSIGTTSTTRILEVQGSVSHLATFRNSSSTAANSFINVINANNTTNGLVMAHASDGTGYFGTQNNAALRFATNDIERARITSGGDLLVGTTDVTPYNNNSNTSADNGVVISNTGQVWAAAYNNDCGNFNRTGSDGVSLYFNRSGSTVGSISVTTTATAFNTTSDYRLKDNQQPLTGSGEFIDALKPKTWDWKSGGKGVGFIAHEVQEVSPGSVVGTKDAVDADGKPVMQAMEYGSAEFIANIIAELQSLRQRVALLEGN